MNKAILEELECPVCHCYMCPPIFLCTTGHSMCDDCFKQVPICPTCRCKKSNNMRNYALEGVHGKLQVPCRFIYCQRVFLGEAVGKHQAYCDYATISCPFRYYNCSWTESKINLKTHLENMHFNKFYLKDNQKFLLRNFVALNKAYNDLVVIFAYNQFFLLNWYLNENNALYTWTLNYLGSPEDAKNYSFELEIFVDDLTSDIWTPLTYKSMCFKPRDEQNYWQYNSFHVHKEMLKLYCTPNGDLNFKVTIYSVKEEDLKIDELILAFSNMDYNDPNTDESSKEASDS